MVGGWISGSRSLMDKSEGRALFGSWTSRGMSVFDETQVERTDRHSP